MKATCPLGIGNGVRVVPETDLRFCQCHHAIRVIGIQFDGALGGLQATCIIALHREPEADHLIAEREIGIEAHSLARFAKT